MSILSDRELSQEIRRSPPLVSGVDPRNSGRWNSAIQPASVDLTIGTILIPGKENDQLGSPSNPRTRYPLAQGQTAVIKTQEKLSLPPDLAGIAFPPSSVSMKGVLMTNPGHVDPGYLGRMSFTVINIGKSTYELRAGDPIVTVLFLRMSKAPAVDYDSLDDTNRPPKGNPDVELLAHLSPEFLDIDERAKREAEKVVKELDVRIKVWQIGVPIIAAALAALLTIFTNYWKPWDEPISNLDRRLIPLEKQLEIKSLTENLEAIERRLRTLETMEKKPKE